VARHGELIRLLRAWLLDHVLQMDFRLKPHLR
jgi:hemerythrin